MAIKISWTDRSINNLNHIYRYIAFDSEVYAKRFVKSLVRSVEKQLVNYPLTGRPVPEFHNTQLNYLKELIYKGYRIIYNPTLPDQINVIADISGRMDLPGISKSDWELE